MNDSKTHILKFGGTSLKDPTFIKQSADIVIDRSKIARPFVVVSALEGITDALISLAENPGNTDLKPNQLRQKHLDIFDQLVVDDDKNRQRLQHLFDELLQLSTRLQSHPKNRRALKDHILSIGEQASALIFASVLTAQGLPAKAHNASQFIKTNDKFGQAGVCHSATRTLIRQYLQQSVAVPVVTGFIGSDKENRITTLGRSGSDYTAGLLADALQANHLEIWTDVDGVLSADPRWVPTAQPITELSFGDIAELSAHGAKVIHPQTIFPIRNQQTSVLVKNSYNPEHPGTTITSGFNSNGELKTITVTGPFVQLQVDQQHAFKLFEVINHWLEKEPEDEVLSFEQPSAFEPSRFVIKQSLFDKISQRLAAWSADRGIVLDLRNDLYKVKKFSNHFSDDEWLTRRIWDLFESKSLRPLSSSRQRDERFISFLFQKDDARLAARLMNDYLADEKLIVDLFVAGTGAIGQALLNQLKTLELPDIQFRLRGICNSRMALWDEQGISLKNKADWSRSQPTNWGKLVKKLTQPHRHNLIFVDATGSEEVARLYPELLKSGAHIATPSKLANTFEQPFFDELQELTKESAASFRYETTVGAGLPVISTIENLQSSGDSITEISGVVSGTMTYLFNQLEQGVPFSKAIIKARELGYAEPDPRDDLSGEDVARKFLTLARILGWNIERKDLQIKSLIPDELKNVDKCIFLERLAQFDSQWQQRIRNARNRNKTLRYTGRLKDGEISIGIELVPLDSPIGQLRKTDNLIQIFSEFYNQTPLVVQGPGAGKKVTAAGVLSDILKTAKELVKTRID